MLNYGRPVGSWKNTTIIKLLNLTLFIWDFRGVNAGFIRSVGIVFGISIVSGLVSDVGGKFESDNHGEMESETGGEVGSRDSINTRKCVKCGVNVIIDDSAVLGVNRGVGDKVFRGVYGQVNISNIEPV